MNSNKWFIPFFKDCKFVGWGGTPWEGTLGSPKGSHGRGPMGEGTLGSPRDPMGGDPGPPMGGEPLGAQGIPWEGTLGAPHWEPFGGPRTNLEVFCDEVSFQEFQKFMKTKDLTIYQDRNVRKQHTQLFGPRVHGIWSY